jgi:hypothetical protein
LLGDEAYAPDCCCRSLVGHRWCNAEELATGSGRS